MSAKFESHHSEEQGATGHECGDEGHITEEARRAIDEIGQVKAGARSHRGPDERVQDGDDVAAGPMWPDGDDLSGEEGHLWHHLSDSEWSRAVELIAQGRLMEALDIATSGDLEFQCRSDRACTADGVNLVARANGDVELALEASPVFGGSGLFSREHPWLIEV